MTGDCRDCKDYRECEALRKDNEGQYTIKGNGKEWYHYGEIRWCPFQCIWIINNTATLRDGRWPQDPDRIDNNAGQRSIKTEASFTRPILILAELESRLERTGIQGKLLVAQVEAGREFDYLDREAYDALLYIKGFRRKRMSFMTWKKQRKHRQNDNQKVVKVGA